ncbi:L,D-transpeptidase family protein [Niallia endozanthoxylica]|uniref:L,D-transpeptidase family protein n=1 Tax=Niallia endozanthoxylica TaxID=2036016 RepID=A0A5J5GV10_9BACI|nr:L,D-transpeptidase family protein [Niallia endozanthoxylica]KAA9012111.1 L,D-transpeptidase family protein [Niallia endozanthoxylica]
MENNAKELLVDHNRQQVKSTQWFKNWKWITTIIVLIIGLIFGAISYYQANHFHAQTTINGIEVGGMTADEALGKLKTSVLKNEVYIGKQKVFDGKDTNLGFTDDDLGTVEELLKTKQNFFPSSKGKGYSLAPGNPNLQRSPEMIKQVEEKLVNMNNSLKAPQDAAVHLENGKVVISKSVEGEQYDIASLLKELKKKEYASVIHIDPVYLAPIKENSEVIKNEEKVLQSLLEHTVNYQVQDKVYSLKGSDVIKNATVTKDLKFEIDEEGIKNKITEINHSQSTLGKDFTFNTHSGSTISVKGQGYGWALDVEKETALVKEAFENGEKSVSASNIYGNGWNNEGYGYETLSNNGIGDTYAEVSLDEQRMWIYKDGKLVFSTNVVTGNRSSGEDTSKGVWYVLYKRSPYVLEGQRIGSTSGYAVKVDYWVPFTNPGQGFHDAGWRTNWSSNAYLTDGSAGCVNVSPSVMKNLYDNLDVYDPVVVY